MMSVCSRFKANLDWQTLRYLSFSLFILTCTVPFLSLIFQSVLTWVCRHDVGMIDRCNVIQNDHELGWHYDETMGFRFEFFQNLISTDHTCPSEG
jgi:hypothetical protein